MATAARLPRPFDFSRLTFHVDNMSPGSINSSSVDASVTETLSVEINDPDEIYDVINNLVGYSYVVDTSTVIQSGTIIVSDLKRVPPFQHPVFSNMYCTKVDVVQVKYSNHKTVTGFVGDSNYSVKYPKYGYLKFTATFQPTPIILLPDGYVNFEYERYLSYNYSPKTEALTRPYGEWTFIDGSSPIVNNPGVPVKYRGDFVTFETKWDLSVTWHQVPEDFVMDYEYTVSNGGSTSIFTPAVPTSIQRALGSVNSDEIWGYPRGTLLALAPTIKRYVSTLYRQPTGGGAVVGSPQLFYVDITFKFVFFDPPRDLTTAALLPFRGHNLKPWFAPGDPKKSDLAPTVYYHVTNNGLPSGYTTYPYANFKNMFFSWRVG